MVERKEVRICEAYQIHTRVNINRKSKQQRNYREIYFTINFHVMAEIAGKFLFLFARGTIVFISESKKKKSDQKYLIQIFNFAQFYLLHQVCFAFEKHLVLVIVRFKNQVLFLSKINLVDKHKSRLFG